jgi:hypothetical protein
MLCACRCSILDLFSQARAAGLGAQQHAVPAAVQPAWHTAGITQAGALLYAFAAAFPSAFAPFWLLLLAHCCKSAGLSGRYSWNR